MLRTREELHGHPEYQVIWNGAIDRQLAAQAQRPAPVEALPTRAIMMADEPGCWRWAQGRIFTRRELSESCGVTQRMGERYVLLWLTNGRVKLAGYRLRPGGGPKMRVFYGCGRQQAAA